jgi:hypothetical protein
LQDTSEAGVFTEIGAEHNIIRDCEGTALGQAIVLKGGYTTVTNCIFHDLVMVVNTEGGGDDFGANGIVIRSGNNELSYNTIYNAIAVSYDYGYDGGAFEMYSTNQSMDNNYIHHNITYDNMGFMEVGSQNGQYVRDNIISYNLSANNQKFLSIHLGLAGFGTQTSNMRVENNTIYEPVDTGKQIFWIWSPAELTTLSFTNNIVYSAVSFGASNQVTFTHSYNLIYMTGGASIGITPNGTEITGQNPNFVNAGADDFNLQSDSPAIDQGSVLSWTLDLDGETVPSGDGPDMGGYEYDSGYTPTPTGTPTATSTPTASLETVSISTLRSCSDLCGQNSDCQDGLICVLGYCKHPDCTTDGDCICTKYCNQGCATNDNCTSGLTCVSGYCRNGYCSSETDCACPTSVGVGGTNTSVLMESGIPLPTILMAGLATILIFISLFLAVI